jgi:hypothetical protein
MNLLKEIKKLKTQQILLFAGIFVVVLYLTKYSSKLGSLFSGMTNQETVESKSDSHESNGDGAAPAGDVKAANPAGMNSGPSPADGIQTITGGAPSSCANKLTTNPADLLPKDNNNQWGAANPNGSGELSNVNLLKAGFHAGIDTVGSSLRNANLQVRSEPPNPKAGNTGPWNQSTIEPDLMRPGLELGCGN